MTPPGAKRKHNPKIPAHIDQDALPRGIYWDGTGKGRWYRFVLKEGRTSRETVATANARMSDLHRIAEEGAGGAQHGTVAWMLEKYHASTKFAGLAKPTKEDYERCGQIVVGFPTSIGKFGGLMASRVSQTHIQRLHERIVKQGHPSKANHVLRYLRTVYKWAGPHLGIKDNPARGIEQAKERQRRRMPSPEAYAAVLKYAQDKGALTPHTKGSQPSYLWMVAEIGYLCRLRGIETNTILLDQIEKDGLRTDRRKGSRNNVVDMSPRLRAALDAAQDRRRKIMEKRRQPEPIRPELRYLFISQSGEPLTKNGLDSSWQRMITAAIRDAAITPEQRWSLHDLKRKGVTDTPGTKADKQDAAGLTEPMMKVYDHSLPRVKPSAND